MAERSFRFFFSVLVLALSSFFSLRPSPELSVRDMDRVAEVEVRMAPVLCVGGVRGTAQCTSSLVIFLEPSPELSAGDVGEAAGGEVILTLGLSVGRVGGIV